MEIQHVLKFLIISFLSENKGLLKYFNDIILTKVMI